MVEMVELLSYTFVYSILPTRGESQGKLQEETREESVQKSISSIFFI